MTRSFNRPSLPVVAFLLSMLGQPASALYDDAGELIPVNATCPVGKERVDGKSFVTYKGKIVGFCCPGCDKQFLAWSTKRKDAFVAAAVSARKPTSGKKSKAKSWTEPYNLDVCVVSGENLGSMGDPVVKEYPGREVRFCCGGCIAKFQRDQAGYFQKIDQRILHDQLRFYPLDTCLVSGKPLVDAGKNVARDVVVGNRLFRVANERAEQELKSNPKKYVINLDAATVKGQRPSYPLETCVVAGGKLGSMGKPVEMVLAGRLLRLCCGGCAPQATANPGAFLTKLDRAWNSQGKFRLPTTSRPNANPEGN